MDGGQAAQHMLAQLPAPLHQSLVADHMERFESDRGREGVAPKVEP